MFPRAQITCSSSGMSWGTSGRRSCMWLRLSLGGFGGVRLSTLQGATRLLSNATGVIPHERCSALGLAAEAGGRYGPALVGTAGNLLGRAPGGIFGTTARLATADDIALGAAAPLAVSGLPAAEVGETMAGTGLAGALGCDRVRWAWPAAGAARVRRRERSSPRSPRRSSGSGDCSPAANQGDFHPGITGCSASRHRPSSGECPGDRQTMGTTSGHGLRD